MELPICYNLAVVGLKQCEGLPQPFHYVFEVSLRLSALRPQDLKTPVYKSAPPVHLALLKFPERECSPDLNQCHVRA